MEKEEFDIKKYPKTFLYVIENDTFNIRCNRCGSVVLKETNSSGYPFQCLSCDENMFHVETHNGETHSPSELNEILNNALCLCLDT